MKVKVFLFILPLLAALISACKGKDEEDLLLTVPADTNFFILADLKALSADLGSDGREKLEKALTAMQGGNEDIDARWEYVLSEKSETDFSAPMAFFETDGNTVASFYVKNADSFRKGLEEAMHTTFHENSGITADDKGTVFIKDSQVWFAQGYPYPALDAAKIAVLSQLGEKGSVLSLKAAKELAEGNADIISFINLNESLAYSRDNTERLIMNSIFDDASYVITRHNFEKGKATGETTLLNYKGEPAPLTFDIPKIDINGLKKFEGRGNLFAAISLDPEMMHSIVRALKNVKLPIPPDYQEVLESLDGVAAFSMTRTSPEDGPASMAAMLTFENKNSASAASEICGALMGSHGVKVFTDDKRCNIFLGNQSGMGIADIADNFKGASMGIVFMPSFFDNATNVHVADCLQNFVITLHNERDGVKIKSILTTTSDQNALITLLELIK